MINRLIIVHVPVGKLLVERVAGPVPARVNFHGAVFELPVVDGAVFVSVTEIKRKGSVRLPVIGELGRVMHRSSREASY